MPNRFSQIEQFLGYLFVNLAAFGMTVGVLLEEVTRWLAFIGMILSIIGTAYTIINQRRKYKQWRTEVLSERNQISNDDG